MLHPQRPMIVAVHTGGVPLPGRVEVPDRQDTAQVTSAVGIAQMLAVPVLFPLDPIQVLRPRHIDNRDSLPEPNRPPPAVGSHETHDVAADLVLQIGQQGRRQPSPVRQVGTVLADDGRQGAQVPFAGRYWSHHEAPPGNVTPATQVWPSVERRMATTIMARARWYPTGPQVCLRTPSAPWRS